MLTNVNVMGNHAKIVDSYAIFKNGVTDGAAIDSCVGTDFYVVTDSYAPELRYLHPTIGRHSIPKSIRADNGARVKNSALTDFDVLHHGNVCDKTAVGTNFAIGSNHGARSDISALADRATISDNRRRGDVSGRGHRRRAGNTR